jgi:hypothetical protein
MRANAVILVVIALLFLVGTVAALIPDTVNINSDKSYLVANNVDQSVIKVIVTNTSLGGGPIPGAAVTFSVDPVYGTLSRTSGTTDTSGSVSSIFKVNTKSGYAIISVGVSYSDGNNSFSQNSIITQKIDHDKPNKVVFIPPYEGTVNTQVAFNASFTDQWGNPIDNIINPNESHTVTIHVHGPAPDDCYFVDAYNVTLGKDIFDTPLDNNGHVPMQIKLTSSTGSNYLSMEAFGLNIPAKVIRAVPGDPFYITREFFPGPPPKTAAGSEFTFTYTLYDKFWNPAGGQKVWINTSSSQPGYNPKTQEVTTQENGKISGLYTEPIVGLYNITAIAQNNITLKDTLTVEFYSASPTTHNVIANPQMMPSRDVKNESYSEISAKVVDEGGNGVSNQRVDFSLSPKSYDPLTVGRIKEPSFSNTSILTTISAQTGADGIARVRYYPAEFVGPTNSSYDQSATGGSTIVAQWNGLTKSVDVTFKNYAYLSAVLTVTPPQIVMGQTFDVNLKLNGDGWNLVPKPIDVMLVIDSSGSMGWNTPTNYDSHGGDTRLHSAKDAATTFVTSMESGNNQVGLVAFNSSTFPMKSLSNDFTGVKTKINSLYPNGATQMRRALYESISDVDQNGRGDEAVKAIILLTDGDWNYDQSILAQGRGFHDSKTTWSGNDADFSMYQYYDELVGEGTLTSGHVDYPGVDGTSGAQILVHPSSNVNVNYCDNGQFTQQNMSIYAQENGIRLYALSFVNEPSQNVKNALNILTNSTGGYYKHAPDATRLNELYAEIALELTEDAGVNTTAHTDFGTLIVDDKLIDTSSMFEYLGYVADGTGPGSTMVDKYNKTPNTHFIPGPDFNQNGPLIIDQTTEWNTNKSLNFNIGLIKRGETWETNFRLRALKEGTYMLFNPGSKVDFTDYLGVQSSLSLKNLSYLTVVKDNNSLVIQKIDVVPICPDTTEFTNPLLPIKWQTTYTGPNTTITDEARYMSESGAWVLFYSDSYDVLTNDNRSRSATFDMRRVAPGKYAINIKAYTTGSKATSSPTCGPYLYNTTGMTFIRLD